MTDVVGLTRTLIQVDTSNLPSQGLPGDETRAAHVVKEYLEEAGVDTALVSRDPSRANLVARIPGSGSGPSLAFVGHFDVVPADARDWVHDPFSGVIDDDGFLHGRGAVDMKNEVAARVVAMAEIARSGFRPSGDLLLVIVADEEDGRADVGMRWLVEAMPEIRTDFAVNEGGGTRLELSDGRSAHNIGVGEKGTLPFRVTALGEAGHASMPTVGDNAIPHLAELIRRLGDGLPVAPRLEGAVRAYFRALLGPDADLDDPQQCLAHATELHASLRYSAPALTGTTMSPTVLHAGSALNILPARASVDVDCRVLPGVPAEQVEAELRARLGSDLAYELAALDVYIPGNASPEADRLMDATAQWLRKQDPDAVILPSISTGFTDSVFLRSTLGVQAIGYTPLISTPAAVVEEGYHNRNERVHVDDLARGVDYHVHLARTLLSG